jgi:hypothetical protein
VYSRTLQDPFGLFLNAVAIAFVFQLGQSHQLSKVSDYLNKSTKDTEEATRILNHLCRLTEEAKKKHHGQETARKPH